MASAAPTSSALPFRPAKDKGKHGTVAEEKSPAKAKSSFALPKLLLEVRDLTHPGARAFLSYVVPTTAIEFAVKQVWHAMIMLKSH
jgi:hypothetical protein